MGEHAGMLTAVVRAASAGSNNSSSSRAALAGPGSRHALLYAGEAAALAAAQLSASLEDALPLSVPYGDDRV
jgi:hypothetical protein